jgi:hypothetical protein
VSNRPYVQLGSCVMLLCGFLAPYSRAADSAVAGGNSGYAAGLDQPRQASAESDYRQTGPARQADLFKSREWPNAKAGTKGPATFATRPMTVTHLGAQTLRGTAARPIAIHPYPQSRSTRSESGTSVLARRSNFPDSTSSVAAIAGRTAGAYAVAGNTRAPLRSLAANGLGGGRRIALYKPGSGSARTGMPLNGGIAGNTVHRKY